MSNKFKRRQEQAQPTNANVQTQAPAAPAPKANEIKAPLPKDVPMSQVEGIDDTLTEMQEFIAENVIGIRTWPAREGGTGATLRLKVLTAEDLPPKYNSVAEVAEDLIESLVEVKETTGIPTFFDLSVTYDRTKKAQARVIKANPDDNTLIAMLSIEYATSNVKGSFVQAKSKDNNNAEADKPAVPAKRTFGFGRN